MRKISYFIKNKTWTSNRLNSMSSKWVVDKTINILIPTNNIQDKIIESYILQKILSVIAVWNQ